MWAVAVLLVQVSAPQPIPEGDRARTAVLLDSIKRNPKGPFVGVAWFCEDGAILPPRPRACVDRGGGRQHGVPSRDARELARYGVHVGTLLAATASDTLRARDYERARALVLEKYLEATLGGWVWKRAQRVRGLRQAEDEAAAAEEILGELAADELLIHLHRPLFLRLLRALPLGDTGADADAIRALSARIADADRRFQPVRSAIHGSPSRRDLGATRRFLRRARPAERPQVKELITRLERFYSPERQDKLRSRWLQKLGSERIRAAAETHVKARGLDRIRTALPLFEALEESCRTARVPEQRLAALGLMAHFEARLPLTAEPLARSRPTRREALGLIRDLAHIGRLLGALSRREETAIRTAAEDTGNIGVREHAARVRRLGRALEWIRARYVQELGAPLVRYQQVEPSTSSVLDHLMRGGFALPLARALDRLRADVEAELDQGNRVVGLDSSFWLRGENPGFAVATLRVLRAGIDPSGLRPTDVVLMEELLPQLPPVAGLLTVGQPGSLSHVSLLARNLGIPHVALSDAGARALEAWVGRKIVMGVSAEHRVLLAPWDGLDSPEQELAEKKVGGPQTFRIDETRLRLDVSGVVPVAALSEEDAGILVGPKAAELARLERLFPDRVSEAVVLPFGTFLRHVEQVMPGGKSAFTRLKTVLREERSRPTPNETRILEALEVFRGAIAALPFVDGFEAKVARALNTMGEPGTFGVFVRSDTNVEDLEAFTGAGLNLTVPNRVGLASILSAIRRVWASPFTERSYRWRQRVLENPEHVYPSVLLQKTVPSDASGVVVTTDLEGLWEDAITLSMSEGVGAVVDGGSAETVVVRSDGAHRLLSSSRIFARKVVPPAPAEGVITLPARGLDPLLDPPRLEEVLKLVQQIRARIPSRGVPWDIELGLVRGRAMLFQIRPLREAAFATTHPLLTALDRRRQAASDRKLDMSRPLRGEGR
ncbi:MAG: PEP/pyruvate-binding domain-containing protein [Myxococcota bacterium]